MFDKQKKQNQQQHNKSEKGYPFPRDIKVNDIAHQNDTHGCMQEDSD